MAGQLSLALVQAARGSVKFINARIAKTFSLPGASEDFKLDVQLETDSTAVALFGVIFFWTPPHFWALAQLIKSDYARAHVPMLPVVAGEQSAKRQSIVYAALTVAASLVPFFTGSAGSVYLAGAIVLGVGLVGISLLDLEGRRWTRRLWTYSMVYVALLFAVFAVSPFLP